MAKSISFSDMKKIAVYSQIDLKSYELGLSERSDNL